MLSSSASSRMKLLTTKILLHTSLTHPLNSVRSSLMKRSLLLVAAVALLVQPPLLLLVLLLTIQNTLSRPRSLILPIPLKHQKTQPIISFLFISSFCLPTIGSISHLLFWHFLFIFLYIYEFPSFTIYSCFSATNTFF